MEEQEHNKEIIDELAHRPLGLVIVETGLLVLIALTALVGNSCVLYVFYKTPRLRTATSYYLITLAISDVAMSVIVIPITIVGAALGRDVFGRRVGEAVQWIFTELVFGSLQTTSLIAINRYYCVVKPSKYRRYFKPKLVVMMITGCWIFTFCPVVAMYSSGITIFQFYPARYMYFPFFVDKTARDAISAIYQVLFTVFPATLSTFCYWEIYKCVQNHKANTASTLYPGNNPAGRPSTMTIEELRLTKSLMALVIGFVLCWIPNALVFHISAHTNLPRLVEAMIIYFTYTSSAINPILYNAFNKPFQKRLLELLRPGNSVDPVQNEVNVPSGSNPVCLSTSDHKQKKRIDEE